MQKLRHTAAGLGLEGRPQRYSLLSYHQLSSFPLEQAQLFGGYPEKLTPGENKCGVGAGAAEKQGVDMEAVVTETRERACIQPTSLSPVLLCSGH